MTCPACGSLLEEAIAHSAILRAPVGDGVVGPHESAHWRRLQRQSVIEVAESVARARRCPG